VQLDRARDVPLVVEVGVLVDLGDDDLVVLKVLHQPACRDQDRLRISVFRHRSSLCFRK
jgi:hypothetical protein